MRIIPLTKNRQLAYRKRRKATTGLDITESQLQQQLEDSLDAYGVKYMRIPDYAWSWLKRNAPVHIVAALSRYFGGMPDCMCMIPISDKYSLALGIELKVKGRKKHGKQKHWQSVVCRTPEENIEAVQKFAYDADIMREFADRLQVFLNKVENHVINGTGDGTEPIGLLNSAREKGVEL